MTGRGRMRLGQPDVQRYESRFGAESHECKNEEESGTRGRGKAIKIQRPTFLAKQHEEHEQESCADVTRHKVCPSGLTRTFLFVFEGDQKKSREGHRFPRHEKQNR